MRAVSVGQRAKQATARVATLAELSCRRMAGKQEKEQDKSGHVIPQLAHLEIRNYAVHFPSKKVSDRICFCPAGQKDLAEALLRFCRENAGKPREELKKECAQRKNAWLKGGQKDLATLVPLPLPWLFSTFC